MWKRSDGWGLDNVPQCDYMGVDCDSAGHVVNITLPANDVKGSIPEDFGFLKHLRSIDLRDNNMDGRLPTSLKFLPLEEFDISGNKIGGFVPPTLCLTGDINENGLYGKFLCDTIACPVGTFR